MIQVRNAAGEIETIASIDDLLLVVATSAGQAAIATALGLGATSAKQDASQTTLAQILAKLIASPSTAANQAAIIALLTIATSFVTGQKKIAVTGTAVQIIVTSTPLANGVTLQANPNNAAAITVGAAGVTNTADGTGNGKVLQPGQSWAFAVNDLNKLWINGTAADWADWSAN